MPLSQVLIAAGLVPVLVNVLLYVFSTADGVRTDSVRMPRTLFWAGTIGGASCLCLTVFLSLFQRRMLWSVIAISAGLLSIVCVLAYYSIRIRYDEDTFLCRRFFSRKIWSYTDIEGVIPGANGDYTLVLKKGKIRVDGMAHGGAQFLSYAEDRHFAAGLGPIPDVPGRLFHGNVVDPVPKAVLMCLPGVALTALAVWSIVEWCSLEVPCSPENADGVLICWAAAVCYWCFVVFAFHILNHAEKHPRLAALLVKKEELNI